MRPRAGDPGGLRGSGAGSGNGRREAPRRCRQRRAPLVIADAGRQRTGLRRREPAQRRELLPRVGASTSPGTSIGVPRGASRCLRGAFAGCAGGPSPDLWTTPLRGCREAWRGSLETTVEGRARRTLRPPRRARRRSSRGLRGPPHRRRGGAGRRVSETSVKGGGRPRRVAPPSMSRASRRVVAEGVGVVCGACGEGAGGGCPRGL